MRPIFDRTEEAARKYNEYIARTKPLINSIANIHQTCLVKIWINPKERSTYYELADGVEEILKEYRHAINEIHYQIYGLKMEFI